MALENIYYLTIPEESTTLIGEFRVDPRIMLPVELPEGETDYNPEKLSWEMVVSGCLKVLAYQPDHPDNAYFRDLVMAIKPDIYQHLTTSGIVKAQQKEFILAEEIFMTLTGLYPDDNKALINQTLLYDKMSEHYEMIENRKLMLKYKEIAEAGYNTAVTCDKPLPEAYYYAGFYYYRNKMYSRTLTLWEAFLNTNPDEERYQEISNLISAVESEKLNHELYESAYQLIIEGKESEGIEKAARFLEINPESFNGWFLLGWACRRSEEYNKAKTAFEKALSLNKGSGSNVLNELAICEMEIGSLDKAEEYLQKALSENPEDVKIISNLGILNLKKENESEAERYFRIAHELEPEDPLSSEFLKHLENQE